MFVTRLFLLLMAKTIKAFEPILCVYGYGDYNKIEDINLVDVWYNLVLEYHSLSIFINESTWKNASSINPRVNFAVMAYTQTVWMICK